MMLDQIKLFELEKSITFSIYEIEKKLAFSNEEYLVNMLKKYKDVFFHIIDKKENSEIHELKRLLNGARGYMETSSNHSQSFLSALTDSEKIVKTICL